MRPLSGLGGSFARFGTAMMNEQQLEDLCIGWFQETGWRFVHGPDIAPDGANPERADYRQVILRDRLLAALARINPHIPTAALEQADGR
jgi:type I restriction enzyme, R subunit